MFTFRVQTESLKPKRGAGFRALTPQENLQESLDNLIPE
jgi:hypothetical protein